MISYESMRTCVAVVLAGLAVGFPALAGGEPRSTAEAMGEGSAVSRIGDAQVPKEPVCMRLIMTRPPDVEPSARLRGDLPVALALAVATAAPAPAMESDVACASVESTRSYLEQHTDRVMRDFFYFSPALERTTDELAGDHLDYLRERDRLLLFRPVMKSGPSDGIGVALFSAAVVMSAHAPGSMRAVFDGPVHLGPAVFDSGGMGAAVGASLP